MCNAFFLIFFEFLFDKYERRRKMTSFRGGKPSRLIPRSFIFFVICSSQNPASETLNLACANQALYFLENARKAHIQFLDP